MKLPNFLAAEEGPAIVASSSMPPANPLRYSVVCHGRYALANSVYGGGLVGIENRVAQLRQRGVNGPVAQRLEQGTHN